MDDENKSVSKTFAKNPKTKNNQSSLHDKLKILKTTFGEERIKFNEKLSHHTFSKLGGPAEAFYIATSQRELINALDSAHQLKIPFFVFGGGTKIMISDKGIQGLVIKNRTGAIKINGIKGKVGRSGVGIEEAIIEADSGVSIGKLNQFLKEQGLSEFQGISSQSATLGGAIFLDPVLQAVTSIIKVWEKEDVFEIDILKLRRLDQTVLSLVLKIKARV